MFNELLWNAHFMDFLFRKNFIGWMDIKIVMGAVDNLAELC